MCCVALLTGCTCPRPGIVETRVGNAQYEWELMEERLFYLPDHPLTLHEILDIALCRNLDLLVRSRQYSYQEEFAASAKLKMLPTLVFEGEVSGRNRNTGASSTSLDPTVPPAPPSISSEQAVDRNDLLLTWNLLDYGIAYYRSRQEDDKATMRKAEYLRARQILITETISQYWKARVALLGVRKLEPVVQEVHGFINSLEERMASHVLSADLGLRYKASLLKLVAQYVLYERNLHDAITQLAKLMGVPEANFVLAEEEIPLPSDQLPEISDLAALALINRPELYGLDAEVNSNIDEIRIAFLQLFPSLAAFASSNFDANRYLIYNQWLINGLRFTWNLLGEPLHIREMIAGRCNVEASRSNRLALSVGILTQLQLAYLSFYDTRYDYIAAADMASTHASLIQVLERKREVGEASELEILANHMLDAIQSEVDALKAFGNHQVALEQINNSVGIPFYVSPWLIGEDVVVIAP